MYCVLVFSGQPTYTRLLGAIQVYGFIYLKVGEHSYKLSFHYAAIFLKSIFLCMHQLLLMNVMLN